MKNYSVPLGRPLGACLVFGGVLFVALAGAGVSLADLSAATEERDAKAELLGRSVAASRHAQAAPSAPAADPFVQAETSTLAAAALDSDLRALAASAGLALLSSRADVKSDEPGASAGEAAGAGGIGTRIEDQAVLEGQNEAIRALLIRLDAGTPAVLVDALAIEPAEAGEVSSDDPQAPRLRVSVTLSAYWRHGRAGTR